MASTLPDSTIATTITESRTTGSSVSITPHTYTPSSVIRELAHMYRKLSAAYTELLEFKSSPTESGSQFDLDLVKYIRITNLDNADNVALAIHYGPSGAVFSWLLRPGESFVMGSPLACAFESEGAPTRDVNKIEARGISATPDVEVVVGSN